MPAVEIARGPRPSATCVSPAPVRHCRLLGTQRGEGHEGRLDFPHRVGAGFYVNGAAFIEGFVNYPSWRLIGEAEFIAYHRLLSPRMVVLLAIPAVAATVFTVLLLRFRAAGLPIRVIWAAIALQAVALLPTATIQVPIQMQMQLSETGLSLPLIDRLIETNWWLRRIPHALCALLFLWMGAKVIGAGGQQSAGASDTGVAQQGSAS